MEDTNSLSRNVCILEGLEAMYVFKHRTWFNSAKAWRDKRTNNIYKQDWFIVDKYRILRIFLFMTSNESVLSQLFLCIVQLKSSVLATNDKLWRVSLAVTHFGWAGFYRGA